MQQLSKIDSSFLDTTHSARNLGFVFDDQISTLSKSYYSHICALRCIRPYLDSKTAGLITTSIVHSKLDYCNSLHYNLSRQSVTPAPTDSKFSCSCCRQGSNIYWYHPNS